MLWYQLEVSGNIEIAPRPTHLGMAGDLLLATQRRWSLTCRKARTHEEGSEIGEGQRQEIAGSYGDRRHRAAGSADLRHRRTPAGECRMRSFIEFMQDVPRDQQKTPGEPEG